MSTTSPRRRRKSRSMFAPIILIGAGVLFLLSNLGVSELQWLAAAQLWPLLLIFIGLNVIVLQVPRPFGTFLSGLVAIGFVGLVGYVLLYAEDNPLLSRLGMSSNIEQTVEQVEFPLAGVETAVITVDMGLAGAEIDALEDSPNLFEADVSYLNELQFDTSVVRGQARIELGERAGMRWLNPVNWVNFEGLAPWDIGLHRDIETDLRVDIGAGKVNMDLAALTLSGLEVNGGAGRIQALLPPGVYDIFIDVGAGSTQLTLPDRGDLNLDIEGGAGSIQLYLPAEMAARLEVEGGAGALNTDGRFRRISGEGNDGIWQTEEYDSADNRVDIEIDIGAGSVSVLRSGS